MAIARHHVVFDAVFYRPVRYFKLPGRIDVVFPGVGKPELSQVFATGRSVAYPGYPGNHVTAVYDGIKGLQVIHAAFFKFREGVGLAKSIEVQIAELPAQVGRNLGTGTPQRVPDENCFVGRVQFFTDVLPDTLLGEIETEVDPRFFDRDKKEEEVEGPVLFLSGAFEHYPVLTLVGVAEQESGGGSTFVFKFLCAGDGVIVGSLGKLGGAG